MLIEPGTDHKQSVEGNVDGEVVVRNGLFGVCEEREEGEGGRKVRIIGVTVVLYGWWEGFSRHGGNGVMMNILYCKWQT